jgi:hypothetical protein
MDRREVVRRALTRLVLTASVATVPAPAVPASRHEPRPLPVFVKGAVKRAVALAREKLQSEECRAIYTDFLDGQGHPLAARLELIGTTPREHLGHLRWVNGAELRTCQDPDIYFATVVGGIRVHVCPEQFARFAIREPHKAAGLLLHEHLHSLGLGENPPTSDQITRQVWSRCGR